MALGMCLLSLLGVDTSRVTSGLYMVVLGFGMGFLMQMTTLVAQNSVQPARHRGGQQLAAVLPADRRLDRGIRVRRGLRPAAERRADLGVTWRAHVHQRRPVRPGHGQVAARGDPARRVHRGRLAMQGVFLWAIPASALAFVLAWFIKEVPLRGRAAARRRRSRRPPEAGGAKPQQARCIVLRSRARCTALSAGRGQPPM